MRKLKAHKESSEFRGSGKATIFIEDIHGLPSMGKLLHNHQIAFCAHT